MTSGAELFERLDSLIEKHQDAAIKVRRHLHRHPETGWNETGTQAFLRSFLTERGLKPRDSAKTGLVVDIGRGEAPVMYRGDIDALPMADGKQRGLATVVSENPGVCHACGHDLHTAVAAGLASCFRDLEELLPGPVRVIFQPAEEVLPSGAEAMVREGITDGVRAAFALHADPARDTGTVGVRTGPLTSTSDSYVLDVIGEQGHSARPHLAHDAILAAADVVKALYGLVSQRVDPLEPAVLNVGTIRGGDVENVIAGKVTLTGVLRTLYTDTRDRLHREIHRITEHAAGVYGCSVDIKWELGSPPVVNDPRLDAVLREAATEVLGPSGVQEISLPSTGAEDFGQISAAVPAYMMRLGVRAPGHPTRHLHTPTLEVDERAIPLAMRVMGRAMLRALEVMPAEVDADRGRAGV